MFLNLDKFIDSVDILNLDSYLGDLNLKYLSLDYFGFQKNMVKRDLGQGISLTNIDTMKLKTILRKYNFDINTVTGHGYRAPSKFHKIWVTNKNWDQLPGLTDFIESLPFFEYTTRIVIIHSKPGRSGVEHADHSFKNLVDEFIWIRTNNKKKFYIKDDNGKIFLVDCNVIWFDSRFRHNSIAVNDESFSLRIDGKFTPFFRRWIARNGCFKYSYSPKTLMDQSKI